MIAGLILSRATNFRLFQTERGCRRQMLTTSNTPFSYNVFKDYLLQSHLKFDLYNGGFNPLPDNKILDWSKLKQTADDIIKYI